MSNLGGTSQPAAGVKLASAQDAAAQAIAAFLAQDSPAPGYAHEQVAAYRALCTGGEPVALAADDGALYVSPIAGPEIEDALRARRYRPGGGTLALRLPAAMGGGAATFVLWASPKYLAAGTGAEQVWK